MLFALINSWSSKSYSKIGFNLKGNKTRGGNLDDVDLKQRVKAVIKLKECA